MEKIDENKIRQFIRVTMEKIVENEFILENSFTCDFFIFVIFLHSNNTRYFLMVPKGPYFLCEEIQKN